MRLPPYVTIIIAAGFAAGIGAFDPPGSLLADPVRFLETGAEWRYRPGLEEASSPDPTTWRQPDFDDSGWSQGLAPFGFGTTPPYGTDLATFDPPMRGNYTSLFLRRTFDVPEPRRVTELHAILTLDDGCLVWINGREVLRFNVPLEPGAFIAFNDVATRSNSALRPVDVLLGAPEEYLVSGVNVITVQVFNRSPTNNDLKFDVLLLDPIGPDLQAPTVAQILPLPQTTVRALNRFEVTFNEPVSGVEAQDLLVAGRPAEALSGSGAGPYSFEFSEPDPGELRIEWAPDHGIVDEALDRNPFAGGSWSLRLDPEADVASVVIHEILTADRSFLEDEDGDRPGWIEVLNPGLEPVSLLGWTLTDDPEEVGRWMFPEQVVQPGEYFIVFASGKDRRDPTAALHTNFRLDVDGEYIGLYGPDQARQASSEFRFPAQRVDVSFGQNAVGEYLFLSPPTPGAPNGTATPLVAALEAPTFSVARGFYEEPFEVTLSSSTSDVEIRYTTDGSRPTLGTGELYTDAVRIEETVPLQAVAFKRGYVPSPLATHTYLFLADVVRQSTMVQGTVDDPKYSKSIFDGLRSIPSVSMVLSDADFQNLQGQSGAEGNKEEVPGSIEMLHSHDRDEFRDFEDLQVHCAIEGHSHRQSKRAFRLKFKRAYGPSKLRYPLFASAPLNADSNVEIFDRVILRADSNVSWPARLPESSTFLRDQWQRDTQIAMSGLSAHGTFVHLYINGSYWGLYNLAERPDASFTSSHDGGEAEDWFATNHGIERGDTHLSGDSTRFERVIALARERGLEDDEKYAEFSRLVDVPHFVDYVILFWYSGFGDNLDNNWYAGMRTFPEGGLKFFMWDTEYIFLNQGGPPGNIRAWVPPYFFSGGTTDTSIVRIWLALLDNPEFRVLFADRVFKHCSAAGALSDDGSRGRLAVLSAFLEDAVIGESARWGGSRNTRDETWRRAVATLDSRMEGNAAIFIDALREWRVAGQPEVRLYPDLDPPRFTHPGGRVPPGTSFRPFAIVGRTLYTLDGSDPRLPGGEVSPLALEDGSQLTVNEFVAPGATVRFHVPTDGSLGSTWVATDFDDSAWLQGPAGLGFDPRGGFDVDILTNIAEPMAGKNTTVYVRAEFDLDDPMVEVFLLGMKFDDGFAAYLNGELVAQANTPEELAWNAAAPRPGPAASSASFEGFELNNATHLLRRGRNVLAIHGLNRVETVVSRDDFLLVPRLQVGTFAQDPLRIDQDLQVRARTFLDGNWSALREARFTVSSGDPSGLLITEIAYHPAPDGVEFIELHNPTSEAVPLEGVEFTNGIEFRFGPGATIAPGGYVVLAEAAGAFSENYPDVPVAGTYRGQLANEGEKVTLRGSDGTTIVSVDYDDGDFWALGADGFGYTLVLSADSLSPDDPLAWRESAELGGSPGRGDAGPTHGRVLIHEVLPFSSAGTGAVELWNPTDSAVDVSGWFVRPSRRGGGGPGELPFAGSFPIAAGTRLAPGDLLVLPQSELVDPATAELFDGALYLAAAGGAGEFSGYLTGVGFSVGEPDVPFGLHSLSTGEFVFTALSEPTLGEVNASPRRAEIAVNEIQYHPSEGESEFLEFFNPSSVRVDLTGWEVRGVNQPAGDGGFVFPPGVTIPGRGFLVLVPGDPELFRSVRSVPATAGVVGPYGGGLDNAGETLRLLKPDPAREGARIEIDRVRYNDRPPWPEQADGEGNSLERISAQDFGADVLNWAASLQTGGTPGAVNTVSEPVDELPAGWQVPGDVTQDARLNIADALLFLRALFGEGEVSLPCGDGSLEGGANRLLLDASGDARVDVGDLLQLLNHLFQRGPQHTLGAECLRLDDCPDVCR